MQDISAFKAKRLEAVAISTLNRNLSVLSAMLNYYCDYIDLYWIKPKIKLLKGVRSIPPKFYTKTELTSIYECKPEFAHIWCFIANTGLRISEFYNLKRENISKDKITIISSEEHRNKLRKYRVIPLNDAAKNSIKLFENNGVYLAQRFSSVRVYQKRFRKICNKIGLENKAGVHCLRHSFGSHMVQNDVSMRKIQELMGHASITTTEIYAHLLRNDMNKEVAKIDL